ncbi:hypothetical protein [Streptomyces sp. NPDC090057]|uniref:hypothetical protein n=1 Tax=Streptomyces sp. NPDC090057 TaxID=3365935 RepID=UPI00382D909C
MVDGIGAGWRLSLDDLPAVMFAGVADHHLLSTCGTVVISSPPGARSVLFVVPTLNLAAHTALAGRADGHGEHMVIVSSP